MRQHLKLGLLGSLLLMLSASGVSETMAQTRPADASPRVATPATQPATQAEFLLPKPPPYDPSPLMAKVAERIKGDKYRFVVVGDTRLMRVFPEKIIPYIQKLDPAFVIHTGDMINSGGGSGAEKEWDRFWADCGEEILRRPWWFVPGNHEIEPLGEVKEDVATTQAFKNSMKRGNDNFKRLFNVPETHYTFEFKNAMFVVLPYPFYPFESKENLEWVEAQLKKGKESGKLIFVINHVPFYYIGKQVQEHVATKYTALFETYGVAAVFSGDIHGYYRTVRNKVPYIISAGGGAAVYDLKTPEKALPDDVYYFRNGKPNEYVYHNGGRKVDKILLGPQEQYVNVVDVDGEHVVMKTLTISGEEWDELKLH